MSDETDFLQKIQGAYATQNSDAKRALNSLIFEYEPVLAQFAALKQEIDRALASVADLDMTLIVERFRPALQTANRLAVDIDTLDDDLRSHADVEKHITQAQTRLTLASAAVYADKFDALVAKLDQANLASELPAATEEPPP